MSILTGLPHSLVPWCCLNWLNDRENTFGVHCRGGCTEKYGGEKLVRYRGMEC